MKHDGSGREMIIGLHRMSWEHSAYIKGLRELLAQTDFNDLDFRSRNIIRILAGTLNFIHKETLGVKAMTGEMIAEKGWRAERPLEGEGICKECQAKPSIVPKYEIRDYQSFVTLFLQNLWAGFVFDETYRQHQLRALQKIGRDDDAYAAEGFYQACGRLVNLGLLCTGKPIQAYCSFWRHRDIEKKALNAALIRNYDLPDISDVGHEKDWCAVCAASVVEAPVNIFELLTGEPI